MSLVILLSLSIVVPVRAEEATNTNTSFPAAIDINSGEEYHINALGKIEYASSQGAVVEREYQEYFYKINIPVNSYYKFEYSNIEMSKSQTGGRCWGGVNVKIYDSGKQLISAASRMTESSIYEGGLKAGTYYLSILPRLSCTYDSSLSFDFVINTTKTSSWEIENNDSCKNANKISLNKKYYGTICKLENGSGGTIRDEDCYTFKAKESGFLTVKLGRKYADDKRGSWYLYVYDTSCKSGCSSDKGKYIGKVLLDENSNREVVSDKIFIEKGHAICLQVSSGWYCEAPYYFSTKFTSVIKNITLSKVKSPKAKQLTVNWKKNGNVNGYEIQYSTDSKFKKSKTVTIDVKGNKTSYTIKKLKSKKRYYIRVRSYKTVKYTVSSSCNNREERILCYSNWTNVKNCKVK